MIRAILFDLGDTLLDFEPLDTRALFKIGSQKTYDMLKSRGCRLPSFGRYHRKQFFSIRWAYFWSKVRGREFNGLELLRKLARECRFQDDENTLIELAWCWYSPLVTHSSVEADLIDTLRHLRDSGIRTGLVSNTFVPGAVMDRHLRIANLLEFFPVRIYSSEFGYRKPDRRIFDAALKQLNVVSNETMFVGDIVKVDIRGAQRVGMKTCLKQPFGAPARHNGVADYCIQKISDLVPILSEIGAVAAPKPMARAVAG